MRLGTYVETRGWMLSIPMVLVALNMTVTMFTVVHERRREIVTLSSLGASPANIAQLFMIEAVVIALIGVGIGYLAGLGFYRLLMILSIGLEVRQKVEVGWSVLAVVLVICVSLIGVLLPSKQASLVSTPLGLFKWKLAREDVPIGKGSQTPLSEDEHLTVAMPMKIQFYEAEEFLSFVQERLSRMDYLDGDHVERISRNDKVNGDRVRRLMFRHVSKGSGFGFFKSNCTISVKRRSEGSLSVELTVDKWKERESIVYVTADLVRKIVLEWGARKTQ